MRADGAAGRGSHVRLKDRFMRGPDRSEERVHAGVHRPCAPRSGTMLTSRYRPCPMTGKFPLQPLLDIANTRMDEAARRLGELIASEQSCQQKLDMLQRYREEYTERFVSATREGIGPDAMRNFSAFICRIDDAIDAQRRVVEQSREFTTQGQQAWMAQRTKVRAFDTLSQRHVTAQAKVDSRREQHATDEHSARQHRDRDAEDH